MFCFRYELIDMISNGILTCIWLRCLASCPSQRSRSCCHIGHFSKDPFLTCSDLPAIYLHPIPQSSYSVFKSTEMPLLCVQWHSFFVYPIQIVVVSEDTTTVCPHLFVFYLPSTEHSPPLSSTTESDSIPAIYLS